MPGEYSNSAGTGTELGTLSSAFGNQKPRNDRPLVNCLWVLPEKADTDVNNPRCPIKWAYIQRVLDNAKKNPEADFRLWIDTKLLDDYSRFCLDMFMSQRAPQNVELHDLHEIPDYADACFKVPERGEEGYLRSQFNSRTGANNVYARVDCARILALDHCMRTEPERRYIIYVDADFNSINLEAALNAMKKYGVAFYEREAKNTQTGHIALNGFIGLATDNENVREQFPSLIKESLAAARQYRIAFQQFHNFLERLLHTSDWSEISLKGETPLIGTKLPEVGFRPTFEQIKEWQVAQVNKQQAVLVTAL